MFLKLKKIIIIRPLFYFTWRNHQQAFPKFLALWVMSLLPIIIAALFAQKTAESVTGWDGFLQKLSVSFSATEQFVYAAAFLPPIIYLIIERYREADVANEEGFGDRVKLTIRRVFDGYFSVLAVALFVLFITITTYTANKTNYFNLQNTYFYDIAVTSAFYCYLYALYCWYLSILDGTRDTSDFVSENRSSERQLATGFSERINVRDAE